MKYFSLLTAASIAVALAAGSCTTETDIDVPNGWDVNTSDVSEVTVDTLIGIDVSRYHQARIFPGLVDTVTERRIDREVTLDLSKKFTPRQDYGFTRVFLNRAEVDLMPQPIYSTGLYAGAGELVTIEVPQNAPRGLQVQIGQHTDDLTSLSSYFREPIVFTRKAISPGTNYLRFPLGGYIWVIRGQNVEGPEEVTFSFKGVYEAPDFVLGVTNPEEWEQKILTTTVPRLDINSRHIAISVDTRKMREYISKYPNYGTHLSQVLKNWDDFMEAYYESRGVHVAGTDDGDAMPLFPERFIFDVQLEKSVASRSTDIQGLKLVQTADLYDEMLSPENSLNTDFIKIANLLIDKYTPQRQTEFYRALDYMPIFRMARKHFVDGDTQKISVMGTDEFAEALMETFAFAAADSAKREANLKLPTPGTLDSYATDIARLSQLAALNEGLDNATWDTMTSIIRDSRGRIETGVASMFFRTACRRLNLNLSPFYDQWGMTMTDADREFAETFPLPEKKIWEINALKKDPFEGVADFDAKRYHLRDNRSEWDIWATDADYKTSNEDDIDSKETNHHLAQHLIDGDYSTYWKNRLEKKDSKLNAQPNKMKLPYYIVVDMGKPIEIDGIFFSNGSQKSMRGFTLQTVADEEIDITDKNAAWTDVIDVKQAPNLPTNEQFADFGRTLKTRYLRIVIKEGNINSQWMSEWSEEDQERAITLNSIANQGFSEFGTFHYQK